MPIVKNPETEPAWMRWPQCPYGDGLLGQCQHAADNPYVPTLDEAWRGIMLTYTEQDFPTSKPYERSVPGWQCRSCGVRIGTSGLPPNPCKCGVRWRLEEKAEST